MYSPEEIKKAKKRVKAKKDFYQHLMTFVIINCFLMALNLLTTPTNIWFHFPLMGWGIGVLFHYVEVFGVPGFDILNQEWEERELINELRRNEKQYDGNLGKPNNKSTEHPSGEEEEKKSYDDSELV